MLALGGPWVVMSKQVSDRNGMEVGGEDDDGSRGAVLRAGDLRLMDPVLGH